jgi:ribonucleotide reductase alpha subunit
MTIETLSEYALDHGHLADAPGLRGDGRPVFQTATGPNGLSPMAHLRMVAVQPFLSGGVSKTVPLTSGVGVEAIEDIFIDAWHMGLRSVAVYRDGSKLKQPLTADEDRPATAGNDAPDQMVRAHSPSACSIDRQARHTTSASSSSSISSGGFNPTFMPPRSASRPSSSSLALNHNSLRNA